MNNLRDLPEQQRPNPDYGSGRYDKPLESSYRPVVQRGTFNQQLSNVGESASTVLNSNGRRNYLLIQNIGASNVFINFGHKATLGSLILVPGGNYEPFITPVNSVSLVSGIGLNNNCVIIEGFEIF